ncbi:tRNA glutamyl-Q(34) synthetase GluQRS [Rubrivirga sp. S365]|uniref:Glutamyl-Q tRNA(Asp) synthetase n=1 Tax=Rubrivirga litoralis TaxID=3075598 RepID=A0ABU3BLW4_9BACT|nr:MULTISPECIES: tRNA glutamyl-Q(34) synthetase GluQRS [unclassified Rubrivirga]MDT0630278.1 tRNA glutamyl-Q(34) synthetase GluQRS [Rubrivirga sp. F394]MDT7855790.1 tRNA glutamyl-Q(34) synthetase GluQRS [Rubrivirga sp. S365]
MPDRPAPPSDPRSADAAPPVGRFAPSPTGDLHVGSALAALAAWASVRGRGGRFVWRVEDLDGPRAVAGAAERQTEDARWLGLDWDEGPGVGGPHAPYWQSERGGLYESALARLARAGRLFPCAVSRSDLRDLASAPHGGPGLPPFPPALRPAPPADGWFEDPEARADRALRFRVDGGPVSFDDRVVGFVEEDVRQTTGDFVLQRRDGVTAYQLAVVVDDLAMGVTEVVRGRDLLDSTARQILLARALGGAEPVYAHVPLAVGADGEKLSKRDEGLTVRALREAGVAPEALVGWLAEALGQPGAGRRAAADVAASFDLSRVRPEPVTVPARLAAHLRAR